MGHRLQRRELFEAIGLETFQEQGIPLIRIDVDGCVIVEHAFQQLDLGLEQRRTELDVVADADGIHQNAGWVDGSKLLDAVSRNQGFSTNAMLEGIIHLQAEGNVSGIASSVKQHGAIALDGETNSVDGSSDLQRPS